MSELSNKDLDRLFREGTEQFDPLEVQPQAWQQMEVLLDRQRRRRWFYWWLLALLSGLLTGIGILYLSQEADPGQQNALEQTVTIPDTEGATPASGWKEHREAVAAAPADDQGADGFHQAAVSNLPPASGARLETRQSLRHTTVANPILATAPQESPQLRGRNLSAESSAPENHRSEIAELPPLPTSPAAFLPTTRWEWPSKAATSPRWPAAPADSLPKAALVIGFNVATESSTARGGAPGPLHLRGGLTLEWRYARHFSISTGLLFSNKKYSAGPGAYTPPKGFWTYQIAPSNTDAACTILEIPLNVSYYLRHHSTSSFFFEVGLSNFFMLEEHYWYDYDDPTPGLIKYWGGENENRHFLAILNVVPGYQWHPFQRLGFQLAPYAQIPLAGVGHGKVALFSFGLNLRVNLTPFQWH